MFLHVVKKVEVCSMLAKLNVNLKKDFESISIKLKNLNILILFSASISHELETHDLQIKLWYNQLKKWFLILILLKDIKHFQT